MRANEWKLHRKTLDFREGPAIMAIVNVTPDSFSDGGQFFAQDAALERCRSALAQGATILDIGGESTRPGAAFVSADEETSRVVPVIQALRQESDAIISVDTTRARVAAEALQAGADIINDISGLKRDTELASVIARYDAGVCIMHSLGDASTMHADFDYAPDYSVLDAWLAAQVAYAQSQGIAKDRICVDPGFGFSKSLDQNYDVAARLDAMVDQGLPVLVGISRKRMIRAKTGDDPYAAELGTSAFNTYAALCGAQILRVHDVPAAVAAARVTQAIREARERRGQR